MSQKPRGFYKCKNCLVYLPPNGEQVAQHYLKRHGQPFSKTIISSSTNGKLALQPKPECAELLHFPECIVILSPLEPYYLPPPDPLQNEDSNSSFPENTANSTDASNTFPCPICSKSFHKKGHLKRHVLTHSSLRPFPCLLCQKRFQTRFTLNIHLRRDHSLKPLKCPKCPNKTFMFQNELTTHLAKHQLKTKSRGMLIRQITSQANNSFTESSSSSSAFIQQEIIPDIDVKFKSEPDSDAIIIPDLNSESESQKIIPDYRVKLKSEPDSEPPSPESESNDNDDKCPTCQKSFHSKYNLQRHLKTHEEEPAECELCGKKMKNKYRLKLHMEQHSKGKMFITNEEEFKCDICHVTFARKYSLRRHVTTHEDVPVECEQCGKELKNQWCLLRHMERHTGNATTYECSFCPKIFDRKYNQQRHEFSNHKNQICKEEEESNSNSSTKFIREDEIIVVKTEAENIPSSSTVHDDSSNSSKNSNDTENNSTSNFRNIPIKRIKIRVINKPEDYKKFKSSGNFDPEKPFKSESNFSNFSKNSKISKFNLDDEKETETVPKNATTSTVQNYSINIPDRRIKVHVITPDKFKKSRGNFEDPEKPFKCGICPGRYPRKDNLLRHLRTHEETPAECEQCGKKMKNKYCLQRHIYTQHEKNERRFPCSSCPKVFDRLFNLQRHEDSHENGRLTLTGKTGGKVTIRDALEDAVEEATSSSESESEDIIIKNEEDLEDLDFMEEHEENQNDEAILGF